MPTNTPNLNLTTYDVATEGSVLFISAWENLIGTLSTSNMNKLDGFAGTTTATLQLLQDRPGSTHISATTADGVNYTATVSGLTSLSSGMIIYLEPDDVNTGNPYLNINSLGNKTMYKIDVDGIAIQLEPGDLIPTRKILLVYDGFSWYATGGINLSDYKISGAIDSLIAIGSSNQPVASSIVLSGGKIGAESIKFDSTLNKDVSNNLMLGNSGITPGTYKGTTYDKYGRATASSSKVRGHNEIDIKDGVTDNFVSINSTDGIVDSGYSASSFSLSTHNHSETYLPIGGKAADSDKLDGNDSTYFAPASSVVTDHGALSGLADDDHPQYTKGAGTVVDNSIVRFDQTTGRQIQSSNATLSDDGTLTVDGGVFENNPPVMRGAKVVITNPYSPKANVYKGQMHCHSTNSDGSDTPTALVTFYKNVGYHFVSITDHDIATPDPGVSGVLFIPGIEIAPDIGTSYHIPVYNTTNVQNAKTGQGVIDGTLSLGAYANIAHPNYAAYPIPYSGLARLSGYYGIEIYNANCTNQVNDPAGYAENRWDELLTDGRKVFGFAVDDNHQSSSSWQANAGWVQVFADDLSVNSILDSLKRGNFYASTGATLSIDVVGNVITATTGEAAKIEWIGKGGVVLRTSSLHVTTDSYTIVGDELYVRIKVTRDKVAGESYFKYAWSNPIWVDLLSAKSSLGEGAGTIRGNLHVTTDPTSNRGGEISVGLSNNYNGKAVLKGSSLTLGSDRLATDAGTAYIDFKSAVGNAYDARIIAEEGTDNGGNLTGKLSIRAASLVLDGALSGTAKASGAEVLAGTSDTKFVTPSAFQAAFGITSAGKALIDDTTVSNQRNTLGLKLTAITSNDDTATSFTPTNPGGFFLLRIAAGIGAGSFALVTYDAITGTAYATLMIGSANIAVTTGALSGTTGVDGKLTISAHTDGKIYIENRLGGTGYIGYLAL